MVKIAGFRGLLYNQSKISSMADVITPPYDVISEQEQRQYRLRSEYNIVRLILNTEDNPNEAAAKLFRTWQGGRVLLRDGDSTIYVYQQEFKIKSKIMTRTGFIAASYLEDFGGKSKVHAHEFTLTKPKEGRLNLMRACAANFSPIFYLYEDEDKKVAAIMKVISRELPAIKVKDEKGVLHKLWRLPSSMAHRLITAMKDKEVFIADGHHRYEAALNYKKEREKADEGKPGTHPYDYVMSMFVAADDPGLVIFPTHRMLHVPDFEQGEFLQKMSRIFELEEVNDLPSMLKAMEANKDKTAFGAYCGGIYYVFVLKPATSADTLIKEKKPLAWKSLDVTILQKVIIEKILGVSAEMVANEQGFAYTRDEENAVKMVDGGTYSIALFLNATRIEQVIEVANAGERMPQKSTYFYPKLITGLVINKLD
jgi:uncharacterized protein (DUF1015 family)